MGDYLNSVSQNPGFTWNLTAQPERVSVDYR